MCTSRAVLSGLPITNMANRKSLSAKLAVPSPEASDRHPHLAPLAEMAEDVLLHSICPSAARSYHQTAGPTKDILSHFGQRWMS